MPERSPQQYAAWSARQLPAVEFVRPDVLAIPLRMPQQWLGHSFCYAVVGGDRVDLIDTGFDYADNWELLVAALASAGVAMGDVTSVTLTHLHPDHAELAGRVRDTSAAEVRMHRRDVAAARRSARFVDEELLEEFLIEWDVPPAWRDHVRRGANRPVAGGCISEVDRELRGGEGIDAGGGVLRVIHTPGHTGGHIVLVDDDRRLVYTGDHVLPEINPGIGLGGRVVGDDPLGDYVASLDALAAVSDYEALPGHGYRFSPLGDRAQEIRAHYLRRRTEVWHVVEGDPDATVWEVARRLAWSSGWEAVRSQSLWSALVQTAMHMAVAPPSVGDRLL